jgi:hypothetical protein
VQIAVTGSTGARGGTTATGAVADEGVGLDPLSGPSRRSRASTADSDGPGGDQAAVLTPGVGGGRTDLLGPQVGG